MIRIILDRHTPPRGKAFNDNSAKRNPLSAQCATLPEGESFLFRHLRATLPEGESFLIFICYVNTYLVLFCYTLYEYRYMDIVFPFI